MRTWLADWLIQPAFQKEVRNHRGASALKAVVAGFFAALFTGPWLLDPDTLTINGETVRRADDPLWYYSSAAFTGLFVSLFAVIAMIHLYRAIRPGRSA